MKFELRQTITQELASEAGNFVSTSPQGHVWQLPEALPIYLHSGRKALHFVGHDGKSLNCYGILYLDRWKREAISFRGPVFNDAEIGAECLISLRADLKALRVGQLRISPYWSRSSAEKLSTSLWQLGLRPHDGGASPYLRSGRVSLAGNFEELCARFARNTRKDLRGCEKAGFRIERVNDYDKASEGYKLLAKLKQRKALSLMPLQEYQELFGRILQGGQMGVLFNAYIGDRLVGTRGVARTSRHVAIGVIYAIDNDFMRANFRSLSIGVPLWVEGMKWAQERGCEWYDVEGYAPDTPAESPLFGVHQFKGQFRPQPVEILTEHVWKCNQLAHALHRLSSLGKRIIHARRKFLAGRWRVR